MVEGLRDCLTFMEEETEWTELRREMARLWLYKERLSAKESGEGRLSMLEGGDGGLKLGSYILSVFAFITIFYLKYFKHYSQTCLVLSVSKF